MSSTNISPSKTVDESRDISREPFSSLARTGPVSTQTKTLQTPPKSPLHKRQPSQSLEDSTPNLNPTIAQTEDSEDIDTSMDNMPSKPSLPASPSKPTSGMASSETGYKPIHGRTVPRTAAGNKRPAPETDDTDGGDFADERDETTQKPFTKKRVLVVKGGGGRGAKKAKTKVTSKSDVSDNETEPAEAEDEGEAPKKRKPPTATANKKGHWSKGEDELILSMKKEERGWQEITNAVTKLSGADRTLTAVRLRYQKVLKTRDIELSNEEEQILKQAEKDVETTEKYRFIAVRYKELKNENSQELSKAMCQQLLNSVVKKSSSDWNAVNVKSGEPSQAKG